MKLSSFSIISIAFTLSTQHAFAQSSLEGFSTGRYEVHKTATKSARRPASVAASDTNAVTSQDDELKVTTKKADKADTDKKSEVTEAVAPAVASTPTVSATPAVNPVPASATVTKTAEADKASEVEEPSLGEQAQSLFSNKAEKIYDYYREQIHPDDVRNNRLEIEFAPVAVYNDSQSNYSFRDYHAFFNGLKFKANVWFTPLIGISGKYMFSMAADMDAMDANNSNVSAKYENLDVGLNFRKYFGNSRKSNSLEFSILYSDDKMNVPSDTANRLRIKTSGLGLGLKARFPTSANYAWVVGGALFPRLQHHESESSTGVNSGASEENTRMNLELGGEWRFSRSSQMVWGLEASSERNLFDGAASAQDPSTGTTPSNVSVTNSFYLFSLGYRWGN